MLAPDGGDERNQATTAPGIVSATELSCRRHDPSFPLNRVCATSTSRTTPAPGSTSAGLSWKFFPGYSTNESPAGS